MAAIKLDLKRQLNAVDTKNYEFYSSLTDEERKSFSAYMLLRFVSNTTGSLDLQEWFIERTNELVNKNHWYFSKNHKDLIWRLYAAIGVGMKVPHPYIASSKKDKPVRIEKLLATLNPSAKMEEIKLSASLMSPQQIQQLLDDHGFDKRERKDYED